MIQEKPKVKEAPSFSGQPENRKTVSTPRGGDKRNIETKKGIGVRDLVNVAVFTVIYMVIFLVCAMTGMVPIMAVLYTLPIALITGIPNMLFYAKTGKFGPVTIMGVLLGGLLALSGYGIQCLIGGAVCGLGADLIMMMGKYKSWKYMLAGHVVFSMWAIFTALPMWLNREAYFEPYRASQGDAFADQTMALLSVETLIGVIVGIAVCGLIGGLIGHAMMKKHFVRAGIA